MTGNTWIGPIGWGLLIILAWEMVPLGVLRAETELTVDHVVARVEGEQVIILYDLNGPWDKAYVVVLRLLRKGTTTFVHTPVLGVRGDVGEGSFAGRGRKIVWDYRRDFVDGLGGDDFFFEIQVQQVVCGTSFWWYAGAIAVAGGAAALLLIKSPAETPPIVPDNFPDEPVRPR